MRTFTERWENLQQCIRRISEKEASASVLVVIIEWLRDNPEVVAHEYFSRYKFEKYLEIDSADYYFEIFELSPVWLEKIK